VLWHGQTPRRTVALAMEDAEDDYRHRFAMQLIYLRGRAGISSQAKLAELLNVSESKVQRWEIGKGLPDAYELTRLCSPDVLNCTIEELAFPDKMSPREEEMTRRVNRGLRRGLGGRTGGGRGGRRRPPRAPEQP